MRGHCMHHARAVTMHRACGCAACCTTQSGGFSATGGAIAMDASLATLHSCSVTKNEARVSVRVQCVGSAYVSLTPPRSQDGGAITMWRSNATFDSCPFVKNQANVSDQECNAIVGVHACQASQPSLLCHSLHRNRLEGP